MLESAADGDKKRLGALKRFWYGVLSFSLQKFLAQALMARIHDINGKSIFVYNLQQSYIERAAQESEHLHLE
jgi:hypothetical protein